MPLSTKVIKTRIKSVRNIKKITKAMEMVSAAKMKKAVEHALATRSYAELALELLINISQERTVQHPLLDKRKPNGKLALVVSSNKGLCGGFNANITKTVLDFCKKNNNCEKVDFITVGKKAESAVKKAKAKIIASFIDFSDDPRVEEIGGLSKIILEEFAQKTYDEVIMIFTNFVSAMKYEVNTRHLLPISEKSVKFMIQDLGKGGLPEKEMRLKNMSQYLFEPDAESLLNSVLPKLTKIQIYQALLESNASEHSARMLAMKNASTSAEDMIDDLELTFNQARQAGITQEIAEISSGALALQ